MIFLTGGTGFIGSHMLYHLLSSGAEVIALRRKKSNLEYVKQIFEIYNSDYNELSKNLHWVEGEITDYFSLLSNFDNVDAVFHLAAMVSFDPRDQYKMLEVNNKGTENIVNISLEKDVDKFVYISSVAALDPVRKGEYITEENFGNNPKRMSKYAESKFKSELQVWRGIEEGLNSIIVNPSVVLGPGIPQEGPGTIFKMLKRGTKYYPEGITGFVDVRDVCKATLQLYDNGLFNERFILSEGNYSYQQLFEWISERFGNQPPSRKLSPKLTNFAWKLDKIRSNILRAKPVLTKEIHNSMHNQVYFSNQKIVQKLNYKFIPTLDSIKDTVKSIEHNYNRENTQ